MKITVTNLPKDGADYPCAFETAEQREPFPSWERCRKPATRAIAWEDMLPGPIVDIIWRIQMRAICDDHIAYLESLPERKT